MRLIRGPRPSGSWSNWSSGLRVLGEPLFYGVAGQAVPPELEASVDEYVDQSHTRALVVLPLTDPEHNGEARTLAVGAVVLESFAAGPGEMADRATLATLGRQARLALARAVRYERIPAVRVWERLGRWCSASRLTRAALWLLPLAAVVAALVFVPSDFRVTCRGQLKPQNERRIFAPRRRPHRAVARPPRRDGRRRTIAGDDPEQRTGLRTYATAG